MLGSMIHMSSLHPLSFCIRQSTSLHLSPAFSISCFTYSLIDNSLASAFLGTITAVTECIVAGDCEYSATQLAPFSILFKILPGY